jgi:Coenzyme PQQ synthesis protein D (PqqD)
MTRPRTWRHADELAEVVTDGRVALLDLTRLNEPPVVLTHSAAAIWDAVDGRRDEDAVVTRVAEGFDVPAAEIREHVSAFLEDLASCHLLARTEAGT